MLAPLAAIRPVMAASASGRSGLPMTVTCSPGDAGESAADADPVVISASRPRSAASVVTQRWMAVRSGVASLPQEIASAIAPLASLRIRRSPAFPRELPMRPPRTMSRRPRSDADVRRLSEAATTTKARGASWYAGSVSFPPLSVSVQSFRSIGPLPAL